MLLAKCHDKRRQQAMQRKPKHTQTSSDIAPGSECTVRSKKEKKRIEAERFEYMKDVIDKDTVTKALAGIQDAKEFKRRFQKEENVLAEMKKSDYKQYKAIKSQIDVMAQYRTRDSSIVNQVLADKREKEKDTSPSAALLASIAEKKKEKKMAKMANEMPVQVNADANVPIDDSEEEEEEEKTTDI
jgi:hypothetical protein